MKKNMFFGLMMTMIIVCVLGFVACGDDDDKDMTAPKITDKSAANPSFVANPINCQEYQPGEVIPFRYIFEDDVELGSFNIEVHSNFDHHSHSTEADDHDHEGAECEEHNHEHGGGEPEGDGEAWYFNKDYSIPAGQKTYEARLDIPIPANAKHGAYHFMVKLTDKAGFSTHKALSIIIEEE